MKITYNRIEYLTSELDIDEQELLNNFNGDIIDYIRYYEDEVDNNGGRIDRLDVFDIDIEIID